MVKNNFAVSIAGGNHRKDRVENDFYETPPECISSLLKYELRYIDGKKIMEPCCGAGAISMILKNYGLDVESSDLVDRGYGTTGVDFLDTKTTDCYGIITNPPFNLSEKFITHALDVLKIDYLALLLKSQYWHSKRRMSLFLKHPPAVIYPMTWRPDFLQRGAPTMDCQWTVWRKSQMTTYQPLEKIPYIPR